MLPYPPCSVQAGGLACLQDQGWQQMLELVAFYKENAAILRRTFQARPQLPVISTDFYVLPSFCGSHV